MLSDEWVSLFTGFLLWGIVLRDSFLTIVQPRTVVPLDGISGRFYRRAWHLWSFLARQLPVSPRRLHFLAAFGPMSVVTLLLIWAVLAILAFALMYRGLGASFVDNGPEANDFVTMFYMSGSTFLTLGLGDITSQSPAGRLLMIAEAATGLVFLSLIVTYMPILDAAYADRETGSLRIQTRAGHPVCAPQFLRGDLGQGPDDTIREGLADAERWLAAILQSHIAHPIVAYYRAQRLNMSWLTSFALVMDTCALLIAVGDLPASRQARATFRMGLRVLHDLTLALAVPVPPPTDTCLRLPPELLPDLLADLSAVSPLLALDPAAQQRLLHLSHLYENRLLALADWMLVELPGWLPPTPSPDRPIAPPPWEAF
jgi:hypothetical protein